MHIIIVGAGKFGVTLTEQLSREGHDVVVIDSDEEVVERVINTYDIQGVCGDGTICGVLSEAEVSKANLIIATTPQDEMNILCCMIARKMGARHCIARVRNPEYSRQLVFMREELGLSMMVNPEFDAANEISRMLRMPSAIKLESFAKGRVDLAEIHVEQGSKLIGKSLLEIPGAFRVNILICAVQRGDEVIIPSGSFVLQEGDRVHFTASHTKMAKFFKALGIYKNAVKSVIIIGGGRIAYYLAAQLSETGMYVKIVEKDRQRCLELSEMLPDVQIICGDGADQELLAEEGIELADACVTLTGIDEENIIISLYASMKRVGKVITKVNRASMLGILESLGNDSVISPKSITSNLILQYVRAKQNTDGIKVKTLYKLGGDKFEAIEFWVDKTTPYLGVPLKELSLKPNILIACIMRGNRSIIPGGDDFIRLHDSVIVVTAGRQLRDLDEIIQD